MGKMDDVLKNKMLVEMGIPLFKTHTPLPHKHIMEEKIGCII
jgi:hypothetical protein